MGTTSTSAGRRHHVLTLAVLFGLEWLALAISPRYRQDWALETVLTVVFVAVLIALHRRLSLSSVSYTALFVFLSLRQEEQKPAHHVA